MKLEDGVLHTFPLAGTRPGQDQRRGPGPGGRTAGRREGAGGAQHAGGPGPERHRQDQPLRHGGGGGVYGRAALLPRDAFGLHRAGRAEGGPGRGGRHRRHPARRDSVRRAQAAGHGDHRPAGEQQAGTYGGPSAIWTLPATWTCVSPFDWPFRKTERSSSGPGRASWPTPCRRRSIRSASTRPRRWCPLWSWPRRRKTYDPAHRQLRQLFL